MSHDLIPFQFDTYEIRVQMDDFGKPWWVVKDVCATLGIQNVTDTVNRLKPLESTILDFIEDGIPRRLLLVNESGLYRIIFRSNKPEAQRFQDWVFEDVLPSLRNTGQYHTSAPRSSPLIHAHADILAWKELAALFEAPLHIALQEGVKYVEKTHGVDLRPLLLASPSQDHIPENDIMLEPTELAQHLGYRSGIAMNKALEALGWQNKQAGTWEPTPEGAPHCTRHAWINGGKSGYNLKYRLSAVRQALQQAI